MNQVDGAMVTPESLTANSSPELTEPDTLCHSPQPEWDHLPERLLEDEAFLWEDTPLRALSVEDIEDEKDKESVLPTGRFQRQLAIRRKRIGGYSASIITKPDAVDEIKPHEVNNLNNILTPRTPIVAEAVDLDRSQDLSRILPKQI